MQKFCEGGANMGCLKKRGAPPPGHSVYVSRVTVVSIISCD